MKAKLDEGAGRLLLGDNAGDRAIILECIRLERVAVWISTGLPINSNSAASQEIPPIYRNRRYINVFTSAVLSHSNSFYASPFDFLKINFNIILPFTPRSPKSTPSLGSPTKTLYALLFFYTRYTPRPSHHS